MNFIREDPSGLKIKVVVRPRSGKNEIVGLHDDALKIKIKAPPVEGAANKMCRQYLAKCLKIPKSSIHVISGHSSQTKRLMISCETASERTRLKAVIQTLLKTA